MIIWQRSALSNIRRRNVLPGADITTKNVIALGRNHLAPGNQDQVLAQTWRIGGIEPQVAGPLVTLEMTRARSIVKWLAPGVRDIVSFADVLGVGRGDHQIRPNLGLGKGGPQDGNQEQHIECKLWR